MSTADVVEQALHLSKEERADLARRLIESIDNDSGDPPSEVEATWNTEIDARVNAVESGHMSEAPWPEGLARIQQQIHPK
jgi:putative addiction module component (TIGR02574 family)